MHSTATRCTQRWATATVKVRRCVQKTERLRAILGSVAPQTPDSTLSRYERLALFNVGFPFLAIDEPLVLGVDAVEGCAHGAANGGIGLGFVKRDPAVMIAIDTPKPVIMVGTLDRAELVEVHNAVVVAIVNLE
jgi:hypothetical protein